MFHVGQKVVCVNDEYQDIRCGDTPVKRGAIYTVRKCFDFFGESGVLVEEICNPKDRGYHGFRFRPVVERKTDIGFAHEILRKVTKKKTAPTFEEASWHS
jgi:hypothetical protein